jgi:hypothetical protein
MLARPALLPCIIALALLACTGCRAINAPSNDRNWSPDQAKLASAEFERNRVTVHNIRNCQYRSADDYDAIWYDKTYDLSKLDEVNFIVCPFADNPSIAHTFLSFGFEGKEYLAVSIEVRKQQGDPGFTVGKSLSNPYEIMYVVGDERDLIGLRANYRLEDVYVYKAKVTPVTARALFRDVMARVNKLHDSPEFYNVATNNCTTNLRDHVNDISPDRIPYSVDVLLPGYSDRLAYDSGLIEKHGTFEETRAAARVNRLAYVYRDDPDFSQRIRR